MLGLDLKTPELKEGSLLCYPCMEAVWDELLYKYRRSIQEMLPKEVKRKPKCW